MTEFFDVSSGCQSDIARNFTTAILFLSQETNVQFALLNCIFHFSQSNRSTVSPVNTSTEPFT